MSENSIEKLIQLAAADNREIEYSVEKCIIRPSRAPSQSTTGGEESAAPRPESYRTVSAFPPVTLKPGSQQSPDYAPAQDGEGTEVAVASREDRIRSPIAERSV